MATAMENLMADPERENAAMVKIQCVQRVPRSRSPR